MMNAFLVNFMGIDVEYIAEFAADNFLGLILFGLILVAMFVTRPDAYRK